jgi:hypothetical protein
MYTTMSITMSIKRILQHIRDVYHKSNAMNYAIHILYIYYTVGKDGHGQERSHPLGDQDNKAVVPAARGRAGPIIRDRYHGEGIDINI